MLRATPSPMSARPPHGHSATPDSCLTEGRGLFPLNTPEVSTGSSRLRAGLALLPRRTAEGCGSSTRMLLGPRTTHVDARSPWEDRHLLSSRVTVSRSFVFVQYSFHSPSVKWWASAASQRGRGTPSLHCELSARKPLTCVTTPLRARCHNARVGVMSLPPCPQPWE